MKDVWSIDLIFDAENKFVASTINNTWSISTIHSKNNTLEYLDVVELHPLFSIIKPYLTKLQIRKVSNHIADLLFLVLNTVDPLHYLLHYIFEVHCTII